MLTFFIPLRINLEKLKQIIKLIIFFLSNTLFFINLNYPNSLGVNMSNCLKIIERDVLKEPQELKGYLPFRFVGIIVCNYYFECLHLVVQNLYLDGLFRDAISVPNYRFCEFFYVFLMLCPVILHIFHACIASIVLMVLSMDS